MLKETKPRIKDGKEVRRLDLLPRQVHHETGYTGTYNPRWVEAMMGVPVGWVCPSASMIVVNAHSFSGAGWPTPPASQRGETLEVYLRKSIDRMKQGGQPFAPTLQVSVEAEARGIDTTILRDYADRLDEGTEELVSEILKGKVGTNGA